MTKRKYKVFLAEFEIGYSHLEKADASMSVAFGEIIFTNDLVDFDFLVDFLSNNEVITTYWPNDGFLGTCGPFPELKVFTPEGVELIGVGNQLTIIKDEMYEVSVQGITTPKFSDEFPHHVKEHNEMFKK